MRLGGDMGPNMGTTINKITCATNGVVHPVIHLSNLSPILLCFNSIFSSPWMCCDGTFLAISQAQRGKAMHEERVRDTLCFASVPED
ncbi:hypothetical protein E2C01_045548 [Portunus trituberculatus]|uniref:Uncharacterized protein n=1 Tax=Portunus trituberculatus TaxID=210409 RepID=A0A5B7G2B8_PORTR|nr:hypothetical protein [Portunus trituberculatus]